MTTQARNEGGGVPTGNYAQHNPDAKRQDMFTRCGSFRSIYISSKSTLTAVEEATCF